MAELRAALPLVSIAFAVGCGGGTADTELDIVFDICRPVAIWTSESSELQRADISHALDLWRTRGVDDLRLDATPDLPSIEIRFADAAPAFHGVYEDEVGVIYVNRDLPTGDARIITIAHELGHAFGLWHVEPQERSSVMNPGNLEFRPTREDGEALQTLWGPCAGTSSPSPDHVTP